MSRWATGLSCPEAGGPTTTMLVSRAMVVSRAVARNQGERTGSTSFGAGPGRRRSRPARVWPAPPRFLPYEARIPQLMSRRNFSSAVVGSLETRVDVDEHAGRDLADHRLLVRALVVQARAARGGVQARRG